MNKRTIVVSEIVSGTSTNVEAMPLFFAMDKAILAGDIINLSLKNCSAMSSSFLNSSIGALFEKYGFDKLKGKLHLSDHTPSAAKNLSDYLNKIKRSVH
jgi:hypothetical protein